MSRNTAFIILILVFSLNLKTAKASNRVALVVGNGAYKTAWLKNPVNDAGEMANVLIKTGFKVNLKINATLREMDMALREFGIALRSGGVGLFYYAGHGVQLNKRNYLIPVDAKIETESDVKYEAVDVGRIFGKMEDARNNLNIVILDASRKNPFTRNFRSSNDGLTSIDAPTGAIVAYAIAPGKMTVDGHSRNGVYSKHLIENIKIPGLTIEQTLKNVRVSVAAETLNKQVPWESSSLMEDFYFNADRQISVKPTISSDINNDLIAKPEQLAQEKKLFQDKSFKTASIDPKDKNPKIIAKDGQYIKYSNNIVYDKKSGLEWFAGPDKHTGGYAAKSWVEKLILDGGRWRMPSERELEELKKSGVGKRNMTPLLETSGWFVWSSIAGGVNFNTGPWNSSNSGNNNYPRAFAVRNSSSFSTEGETGDDEGQGAEDGGEEGGGAVGEGGEGGGAVGEGGEGESPAGDPGGDPGGGSSGEGESPAGDHGDTGDGQDGGNIGGGDGQGATPT